MSRIPFSIVNVFTSEMWTGNHLVVVRSGGRLSDARMQAIAREIGPAAFVMSDEPRDGVFDLRVFTPAREIMYCGHPVVGASHVIQTEMLSEPVDHLDVTLPSGPMRIGLARDGDSSPTISQRQEPPRFGVTYPPEDVLGCLTNVSIEDLDLSYPLQEVSTGLPYVVVPVRTLAALQRLSIDPVAYADLVAGSDAKTMLLFAPETLDPDHDMHVRVFAHHYGIPEDPATGSASGALGAYLLEHDPPPAGALRLRIEQGHMVHRPGSLELEASTGPDGVRIDVGGKVVTVASGELH